MKRNGALGLLGLLTAFACTGTGGVVSVPLPPTAIVVDPAEFLGNVPCLPAEGAMRRYVATLVSVHAGGAFDAGKEGVTLPSSPPTRCSDRVSFQRVVDGTAYVAEIDGYDVDDIRPLGGDGGIAGSRVMVDRNGRFVAPRWQTSCGKHDDTSRSPSDAGGPTDAGDATAAPDAAPDAADAAPDADAAPVPTSTRDATLDTGVAPYGRCTGHALVDGEVPDLRGPVCARLNMMLPMRGCAPLREVNPVVHSTAVTVSLAQALDTMRLAYGGQCLRCGDGPGQVAGFRVELDGSSKPAATEDCGKSVRFEASPGELVTFTVTAYGSGAAMDGGACKVADGGAIDAATPPDAGNEVSDGGAIDAATPPDAGFCAKEQQIDRGNAGIWCTRCYAQAISGVTVPAACDPLDESLRRPY